MKALLLVGTLLLARPTLAQTATAAGEPPSMLADVQDEVSAAHLKPLKKTTVNLKPVADKPRSIVTLTAENLTIRLNPAKLVAARSASAKVQQKYTRALKQLRVLAKEGKPVELNQPATRDLEHLLATWALPQGAVQSIEWRDQPVGTYTVERYGGGPNQSTYPEGQIFYFYVTERTNGFYVYMNVPRPK